jgi:hypothetical protein
MQGEEMSDASRLVLDGLREKLLGPRAARSFVENLEDRIRQLPANMVDGRVLPKPEVDALRAAVIELVRSEALPRLSAKNENDAIIVLDKLRAYGWTALEDERPCLERARASKHPSPPPAKWPELEDLRSASEQFPKFCIVRPPVENVYFAHSLREEGLTLPDELLGLYAAHDGFDLACIAEPPHIPVFSLLPSGNDVSEATSGYPRRVACFQGGDEVELSVYRDRKQVWWLVYELEYPLAKKAFELQALLRFGLRRMRATSFDALNSGELSWDSYFDVADSSS